MCVVTPHCGFPGEKRKGCVWKHHIVDSPEKREFSLLAGAFEPIQQQRTTSGLGRKDKGVCVETPYCGFPGEKTKGCVWKHHIVDSLEKSELRLLAGAFERFNHKGLRQG